MNFLKTIILSIALILVSLTIFGQETDNEHNHEESHKNHIGTGAALAFLTSENSFAPGIHLHYIRQFGKEYRWGTGIGYEAIIDEHSHNGVTLLLNYRPIDLISLIAGPGLVFTNSETKATFHSEVVFEFDVCGMHAGPMIGFGIDPEETHFAAGIHIGIGF